MVLYHSVNPLVWTSSFFLLPSTFAMYKKKSKLFILSSTISTFVSMHYWATKQHSLRYLCLNTTLCKINGFIYILHGHWNISNGVVRAASIVNLISLLCLYKKSQELFLQKSMYWIYYHMGFHVCSAAGGVLSLL